VRSSQSICTGIVYIFDMVALGKLIARVTSMLTGFLHNAGGLLETKIVRCVSVLLLVAAAVGSGTNAIAEGDASAGKMKAAACAPCHGATGASPQDVWPNLSAQRMGYIVKQLKAFRDGSRKDAVMGPLSKGLTDQDIEDLAAYFSSQPLDSVVAAASPPK
jgi:cytochrome c553